MNERIRELAIQSGLNVPYGSDHEGLRDFDYRNFAELIVRECSTIADKWVDDTDNGQNYPSEMIQQHFGVKE
jgi:hypothetical protein